MVKAGGGFPGGRRVTGGTIVPQFSLVQVLVAARTLGRQPQVSSLRILTARRGGFLPGENFWIVTTQTGKPGVLALKGVAGLAMIEGLAAGPPINNLKVHSNMFGMAAGTVLPLFRKGTHLGVVSRFSFQAG
jgi:hypothetical protein